MNWIDLAIPCPLVMGIWVDGRARILEGQENDRMTLVFKKEYGAVGNSLINLVGRLRGERLTTIISIELEPPKPNQADLRS